VSFLTCTRRLAILTSVKLIKDLLLLQTKKKTKQNKTWTKSFVSVIPKAETGKKNNKPKSVSEGKPQLLQLSVLWHEILTIHPCFCRANQDFRSAQVFCLVYKNVMFISLPIFCPTRLNKVDDDAKLPPLKYICTLGSNTGIKTLLWSLNFTDYRCCWPIPVRWRLEMVSWFETMLSDSLRKRIEIELYCMNPIELSVPNCDIGELTTFR